MNKQFTASEVRRTAAAIEDKQMLVSSMLRAYADRLEADEKAVPVMVVNHVSSAEHDLPIGMKLYAHPAPSDAERLAEALRRTCRKMKTFSRTGALDGAVAVWVDEIESVLAAHSAQAQPNIPDLTDEEWEILFHLYPELKARLQKVFDAHDAQAQPQNGDWVLVPRDPTHAMRECAASYGGRGGYNKQRGDDAMEVWRDMLAAVPQPPAARVPTMRYFIGGPRACAYVDKFEHVEAVITALCDCTGDDRDDYTSTDLIVSERVR